MSLPYNTAACFVEKPGIIHSLKKKKKPKKKKEGKKGTLLREENCIRMLRLKHIDFSSTRLFRLKMPILNPFMTYSSYEVRMSFTIIPGEKKS